MRYLPVPGTYLVGKVGVEAKLDQVDHLPPGRLLGIALQEVNL